MTENYREIIKNNNFRFENYKLACKELDEKVKTGKSKLLQLDEWNRHFAFHKESNAIVIDVIRDTPLPKINKRKRIKGKWTMLIQSILYDAFSKQMEETGTYEIKGTKKDYMKLLGLCSPFYLKARYKTLVDMLNEADDDEFKSNLTCYLEAYHIDDDVWLDFCLKVERAFTNIISNAFKSLEDHNLISSDKDIYIIVREKYSGNGKSYYIKEYATDKERAIIERYSRQISEELTDDEDSMKLKTIITKKGRRKFSNSQIMFLTNSYKAYQEILNESLQSALNCVYVYRLTSINIGSEADLNLKDFSQKSHWL